jgi:hypothetical protein
VIGTTASDTAAWGVDADAARLADMYFLTRNAAGAFIERMRIFGTGNTTYVGINGSGETPANTLGVVGKMAIGTTAYYATAAPTSGLLVEGAVGIGTPSPGSKLGVSGGVAVGAAYAVAAAPTNGVIIEGKLGVATNAPTSQVGIAGNLAVGATYAGALVTAPTNGLAVEGDACVHCQTPTAGYEFQVTGESLLNGNSYVNGTLQNVGTFINWHSGLVGNTQVSTDASGIMTIAPSSDTLQLGGGAAGAALRLLEPSGSGTNYTEFVTPALAANVSYTLPNAQGAASTLLTNNGAGTLSWTTLASAGIVSGTGASTQVTYWTGANTVSGDSGFTYDAATDTATLGTAAIVPTVYGGSAVGSDLSLCSTSGAGDGTDTLLLKVGNNCATTVATVNSTGIGVGSAPIGTLSTASNTDGWLYLSRYETSVNAVGTVFMRARGTSALPSALAANDVIGTLCAKGYHSGGAFNSVCTGLIRFIAAEAFTGAAQGTNIGFYTTPVSSAAEGTLRWSIKSDGLMYGAAATAWIVADTADAADSGRLIVAGGGYPQYSRGAYVVANGNEFTTSNQHGDVYIVAGQGDGGSNVGDVFVYAGNAERMKIDSTGNVNIASLTASRLAATDSSKNLVSTITSANAAASVSDETGTGKWVFNTSPDFVTSVTTSSATFAVFNTGATTVNAFGGASTALNMGNASGTIALAGPTTIAADKSLSLLSGAGQFLQTSTNSTGTTTSSSASLAYNSLTSGTGLYAASSTLSSGKLVDLQVSGTAAASNTQTVLNIATAGANGTASQTTYGLQVANTHTGTSSTNVAGYFSASSGTNNYGLIVNSGFVGIGTATPSDFVTISQPAISSAGYKHALIVTPGSHTSLTNTESPGVRLNGSGTRTVSFAGGGSAFSTSDVRVDATSYSADNAQTINVIQTLRVDSPSVTGTNITAGDVSAFIVGSNSPSVTANANLRYAGLRMGGPTVTLIAGSSPTSTTWPAVAQFGIGQPLVTSGSALDVALMYTGWLQAAPTTGGSVTVGEVGIFRAGGANSSVTLPSAAALKYRGITIPAQTVTITGTTNMTATVMGSVLNIDRHTFTDASAATADAVASLYIANSPACTGSLTCTNTYAIWVDAGITRLDGALQLGSTVTQYNGTTTTESGVPSFQTTSINSTGQTANIAATNIKASAAAGRYRMCVQETVTTAATTSSTLPTVNCIWTDNTDSVAKTVQVAASNNSNTTATGTTGCCLMNVKASTNIQYSTTNYASVGATPLAYDLYITLETL